MRKTITKHATWWRYLLLVSITLAMASMVHAQVYLNENFTSANGTTPPTGWTNITGPFSTDIWSSDNPGSRTISGPGFSGKFFIFDCDYYTQKGKDATLTTPLLNLSTSTLPYLQFSEQYHGLSDGVGTLEYSIDSGNTWTTLSIRSDIVGPLDVGYPSPVVTTIPVPAAAGHTGVKFRWNFWGSDSWWWAIDAVLVAETGAPIVQTSNATAITTNHATCNATIITNGGTTITRSGILFSTTPAPILGSSGIVDSITSPVTPFGSFSVGFSGLTLASTYHYRAYVVNATDTAYGGDSLFTTNATAVLASVTSLAGTDITANSATLGGNISSDGGAPVTSSGVVTSLSPNPTIGAPGVMNIPSSPLVGTGNYTVSATGLTHSSKYYFRAYAINAVGTAYGNLDSFATTIVITSYPYFENFDSATTLWKSTSVNGGDNDWQLGTPTKTNISAAYSAPNAFVTSLSNEYSDNSNCAVVSPQFDLSSFTADPILRFKHNFDEDNDPGFDGSVVEISINGGAWTTLDDIRGSGPNFITPYSWNWYNDNFGFSAVGFLNSFSGSSSSYPTQVNGWITSYTALNGAAGQNNVKIRFHFGADGILDEGWAIDNIEIISPSAPTVLTDTAIYITNASATLNGNITDNGLSLVSASGIVLDVNANPTIGNAGVIDLTTNPVVFMGPFSANASGLSLSTQYHYRAYAINAVDTTYGADSIFTTMASAVAPTITASVNTITETSFTLEETILTNGGAAITASGFVYSTIPNPIIGGPSVIDTSTNPVVAAGSFSIDQAGLSPNTTYYYKAYAINAMGTTYTAVDSFKTKPIYTTLPYSENFDSTTASDWHSTSVGGGVNDWELGTPSKTFISGAHSGSNAWVTKLTGSYSAGADAAVVSPMFDFSSQTADPILSFSNKFSTFYTVDVAVVEMSINNGPYVIIDDQEGSGPDFNTTTNESFLWYNNVNNAWSTIFSNAGFSGSSNDYSSKINGWVQSSARLIGAAGQSNVRIRIRFASVSPLWSPDEGMAFDDVTITTANAPTVATGTLSNLTVSNVTLNGTITDNGRSPITASGILLATTPAPSIGNAGVVDSTTSPLVSMGSYSFNFGGLTPSTMYFYRAYAINAIDTSYGSDSSFTTPANATLPVLMLTNATDLATTSITLHATITNNGGASVTASGMVYGLTPDPSIGDAGVVNASTNPLVDLGAYNISLTGLIHSTKYYYRAYAINTIGTVYSTLDSFTTDAIITSLPYTENFDGATTPWTAVSTGGSNSWVRGTPAKTFINGAYSAPNAFVTKLSGNYSGTEDCAVVSPQFDFTTYTNNPIIRFRQKFKSTVDPNYDGMVVEISINGGSWTRLNNAIGAGANRNTATSYAWYNNSVNSGSLGANKFSGQSSSYASADGNGWIETATVLTGAAGQSNVRIRFRFWADVDVDEGNAIDNIEVVDIVAPTMAASAVNLTAIGNNTTTVNWTNGNGQGRLVVARLTSSTAVIPSNNMLYNANTIFGSGDSTGMGNKIVFNGPTSMVSVTNLEPLTNYTYDVYEYNGKYMHIQFAPAASNVGSTLPVTLTTFMATAKAKDALLTWTTASETNNRGFEIERSLDGRSFESVGFVKGAGNSNHILNYAYTDSAAFAKSGVWYYRLKQMDFDSKYSYSQIVKVSVNTNAVNAISVYPNPFKSEYTVSFSATQQGVAQLELVDIQGRVLTTSQLNVQAGSNEIPITETKTVQSGIYFLRINLNGESQTIKLVKE